MPGTNIQVGVIGAGGMGTRHARNLTNRIAGAGVVAVMDIDQTRATTVATECGGAKVFGDASALIADPAVEAVVIVSPDFTHAPLTLECLAAGKPVLCEKPLATSLAEAKQVLEAEIAVGRRLVQLGFMREYDPAHLHLKHLLDRGEIGRPLLFRGLHANLDIGLRTVEDVIINSAIHDIHSLRWLLGDEVESIYVQYIPAEPTRPESCRLTLIHMRMRNGMLAVIETNTASGYGYEVEVAITGEAGTVYSNSNRSPVVHVAGARVQAIEPDWLVRFEVAYVAEAQAWIQALLAGQTSGPSVWDGYTSLIVAEAAIQSARTGQPQTVAIPERPKLYGERA